MALHIGLYGWEKSTLTNLSRIKLKLYQGRAVAGQGGDSYTDRCGVGYEKCSLLFFRGVRRHRPRMMRQTVGPDTCCVAAYAVALARVLSLDFKGGEYG